MSKKCTPPMIPKWLLEHFLSPNHDSVIGDLEEEYNDRKVSSGVWASVVYWLQTLKIIPAFLILNFIWSGIMFKNYIKIALRNFRKNIGYSMLNILGLVVGMACFILMMLFVQHELSYDKYHENSERIYRVVTGIKGAAFDAVAKVGGMWGPTAVKEIPEVENAVRFSFAGSPLITRGDKSFYESGGFYADSTIFEVFSFKLRQGDPKTALTQPHSIVLTEELARKYFEDENPVGQSLTLGNSIEHVITGILEPVPSNSHFTFNFLISLSSTDSPNWGDMSRIKGWLFIQSYTYLLLSENAVPQEVEAKFTALLNRHLNAEQAGNFTPSLQKLTDIHLHSNIWREISTNSDISTVYIFSAIAFFILLIACFNFMNLASARSTSRATEVGLRKVVGAHRFALIKQLLGESVSVSILALILAIGLAELVLPHFNTLIGRSLELNLTENVLLTAGLFAVSLLVGVFSGIYPALVLSAFKPSEVLKGNLKTVSKSTFRKALVVTQFAISILLFIATATVFNQMEYIRNKKLGFNKEQLVLVPIRDTEMRENFEVVKQELLNYPGIVSISASSNQPGGSDWGSPYRAEGIPEETQPPVRLLAVDHDFIPTYEMEIVQGRNFSKEYATDVRGGLLINEEAARQFGWQNPLGKKIYLPWWQTETQIIGVVRDFHFRSMHEEIGPLLFYNTNSFNRFTIRIRAENMSETLSFLEEKWPELDPDNPLTYSFFDQQFDQLHQQEAQFRTVLMYFSGLAILIACLGLLGLTSFAAEQRTKEIGVRKVVGATMPQILWLLSKDFSKLILAAFIVACPIAYYVMNKWLAGFAYRTDFGASVFIFAGFLTFLLAGLTVSYQSIKAALTNPVDALRYE